MRRIRCVVLSVSMLLACFGAPPARAASLEFEYSALERLVATALLTQGGRLYLSGQDAEGCAYAFVQQPRIDAEQGRLRVTFLFSGRQAVSVAGRCVGPSGTFDIQVSGVPAFVGGEVLLDQLAVETTGRGQPLFKLVAPLIESRLAARLRFPLQRMLGVAARELSTSHDLGLSFDNLSIPRIEVRERSVRLVIDSDVVIK
jgi:hypothetical protein